MKRDASGIFVHDDIAALHASGGLRAPLALDENQVQPTSLDLRLGPVAHRIRAGFLPHRSAVEERLRELSLYTIDLEPGAVLERGHIYLVPLVEELLLPPDVRGRCNPKSSTGRIDLFTRVITDRNERFDDVAAGYRGRLFLEVMPRSFPVRVKTGQRLNQIRFLRGATALDDAAHRETHVRHRLVVGDDGAPPVDALHVDRGFHLTVRLEPLRDDGVIAYRARRFTEVVDLERIGAHDPARFFEPLRREDGPRGPAGRLLLEPEEFYIFVSREKLRVPPDFAAEMLAVDVGIGELRTNYAGFFDPGFGWMPDGQGSGVPAVLEVRPHDVPFLIDDGQVLFRIEFHRTTQTCTRLYGGPGLRSSYARQGLTLAKFFRG